MGFQVLTVQLHTLAFTSGTLTVVEVLDLSSAGAPLSGNTAKMYIAYAAALLLVIFCIHQWKICLCNQTPQKFDRMQERSACCFCEPLIQYLYQAHICPPPGRLCGEVGWGNVLSG